MLRITLLVVLLTACGGGSADDDVDSGAAPSCNFANPSTRFLPYEVGNSWAPRRGSLIGSDATPKPEN